MKQSQPRPPRKLLPKPSVSSVRIGPSTQATASFSSITPFPESPITSTSTSTSTSRPTSRPGQRLQRFPQQPLGVNNTPASSTTGPQLPADKSQPPPRAYTLPPLDSRQYTPLQTTPSTPESRVFESQSPTERRSFLAGQFTSEILTGFASPKTVDIHKLFENCTPQQKREISTAFHQEHPKLDAARKQLRDEEKRIARVGTDRRITQRTKHLDDIWPGWMPQEIRDNYGPTGIPEKVINAIYRIVKAVTSVGSFEFDLFWTETGLFRQALKAKAPNTNQGRFTGPLAEAAELEVDKYLGQGGIEALRAAQLPQDTNPEVSADDTLASVSDPSSTALKDEVTGTNILDTEDPPGNDTLSFTSDGGLTLPEDDLLPDFVSFQDELEPNTWANMAKRDASQMDHPEKGPSNSRRKTEPLTADKIRRQLTDGQRLTDDVLHLLCRAMFLKHADANGHVVLADPLWFYNDTHSEALPSSIRSFGGEKTAVYFPIHHSGDHWALATLERLATGYVLGYYDSLPGLGHFKGVTKRIEQWLGSPEQKNAALIVPLERSSPVQDDTWSCGLHVVKCLSSVLQREDCPTSIDIGAVQHELLQLLRETRVDKGSRFAPDEAAALKNLKEGRSKSKLMAFDDRLSKYSLQSLLERLADAKERREAAVNGEMEARETIAKLEGKMEMREEMGNACNQVLESVISCLDTKETQTPRRRSHVSSRRSSRAFNPESRISDRTHEVIEKLKDESDKKLSREKTLNSKAVREGVDLVISQLSDAGSGLEAEIKEARTKLSLAQTEMMDARKHFEGCEKAIQAKEAHDKALRALADLEGLTEEKKKWSAAVDNDEISLPDMDYSDDSELD